LAPGNVVRAVPMVTRHNGSLYSAPATTRPSAVPSACPTALHNVRAPPTPRAPARRPAMAGRAAARQQLPRNPSAGKERLRLALATEWLSEHGDHQIAVVLPGDDLSLSARDRRRRSCRRHVARSRVAQLPTRPFALAESADSDFEPATARPPAGVVAGSRVRRRARTAQVRSAPDHTSQASIACWRPRRGELAH
jgi:hypothetical protein